MAYQILRNEPVCGVIVLEGEEKHLREFTRGHLSGSLLVPFRTTATSSEFSRMRVQHLGRRVLELRWSKAGEFKLVAYEPAEWEDLLDRLATVF